MLTIRTIDIGADKPLDRGHHGADARHDSVLNPALGQRAIRWSLAEPAMFRQQLRAVIRAAQHGPVRLLIPMVGSLRELEQVHEHLNMAFNQLDLDRSEVNLPVGVMVEVPAAAISIGSLLPALDFVSIGTNDLIQYTLAIDRADEAVSRLYDPWHPAVLALIANVITEADRAGKDVSVCGEMAGDPDFTALLLGYGLRQFSMHPSQISEVKQAVLRDRRREGLARNMRQRSQAVHSGYLISNEPHVAHLVSDLSDSLSPIPTRRSGHGVQPHPVPARHIAA
jgi:phosphotransferase system enzyme I (PtsI)